MSDPNILLMQYIEVLKKALREKMSEQVGVKEKTKEDIIVQEPNLWHVVYYNDNVTPMDFVIRTLKDIFRKPNEVAYELTMKVHETGNATVATLPYEIAEQKATEVTTEARNLGYPLKVQLMEDK
tara:strand:- start:22 stop:396 length:375 start_codon:yes stop_codon:yes gene_type:complete